MGCRERGSLAPGRSEYARWAQQLSVYSSAAWSTACVCLAGFWDRSSDSRLSKSKTGGQEFKRGTSYASHFPSGENCTCCSAYSEFRTTDGIGSPVPASGSRKNQMSLKVFGAPVMTYANLPSGARLFGHLLDAPPRTSSSTPLPSTH